MNFVRYGRDEWEGGATKITVNTKKDKRIQDLEE